MSTKTTPSTDVTAERLKSFIERVERLEETKREFADEIKGVYAEAQSTGFDPKIMRQVIRKRKLAPQERQEQDELLDTYMSSLGMA